MVVGSIASSVYGDPRLTQDIDVVVDLRAGQVAALCAAFSGDQYYVSSHAATEAVRQTGQFSVIHPASGTKIDFIMSRKDRWARAQMERRQKMRILPDRDGYVARPEDIIISKMQYYQRGGSEKHLRDITGILKVSAKDVDRADIAHWAAELGLTEIWQAVLRRLGKADDEGPAGK